MPVQYNSTDYYSPAGNTVALSATSVSSYAAVTSLFPVQRYRIVNAGTNPVQCRFYVNTSTGTATFPTVGTPSLGPVINGGWDATFSIPAQLQSQLDNGFTTTAVIAVISSTGTNPVYITPMMGT
jgi:hypothetical protein